MILHGQATSVVGRIKYSDALFELDEASQKRNKTANILTKEKSHVIEKAKTKLGKQMSLRRSFIKMT